MRGALRLFFFALPLFALLSSSSLSQDRSSEIVLSWSLPHDRAAGYDLYDLGKKAPAGRFVALSCELDGKMGMNTGSDLPWRFVFRTPAEPVKVGATWEVREGAFDESPAALIDPLEIVGAYRLKEVKSRRLSDLFPLAHAGRKEKLDPVEVAVIEGRFDVFRCHWPEGKRPVPDKKPCATMTTLVAQRLSDRAIVAARWQWKGRMQDYAGLDGPTTGNVEEGREVILTEPGLELSKKALKPAIDEAVDRGVKWLKSQQAKDGSFCDKGGYPLGTTAAAGSTALCLQALLHSGVPANDPAIERGFAYIRTKKLIQTYDLGLYLMALEAKYLPITGIEDIEKFDESAARKSIAAAITKEDKSAATDAAQLLLERQDKDGFFGYSAAGDEPNLSNSQYAFLGLKSASRMGVHLPESTWKEPLRNLERFAAHSPDEVTLRIQRYGNSEEEMKVRPSSWGYHTREQTKEGLIDFLRAPSQTMTLSASSIAVICMSTLRPRLNEQDLKRFCLDAGWRGLASTQKGFTLRGAHPPGMWWGSAMSFYSLYGLERALVLLDVDRFDRHDWYHEGALLILASQNGVGSWEKHETVSVLNTAFALLFLKRATIPIATGS